MRRFVSFALLLLLLAALVPQVPVHAAGAPRVDVRSQYILDRYGFATINETVKFNNNGSASSAFPSLTFGFGNLASDVVAENVTTGFSVAQSGGLYTVSGGQVAAGGTGTYTLSLLLNNVATTDKNGSIDVLTLSAPTVSPAADRIVNDVVMPLQTQLRSAPQNLTASLTGSNNTYWSILKGGFPTSAITSVRSVASSSSQDFNPLRVYYATRTVTAGPNGLPLVTDKIAFQNMGTTTLSSLYVKLAAPQTTKITVLTSTQPRLINPIPLSLSSGAIQLGYITVSYPTAGIPAGDNFTIDYQYPLGSSYYTVSGGQVNLRVPQTAPLKAFIGSYSVAVSLSQGTSGKSTSMTFGSPSNPVTPWQGGSMAASYSLSFGWAVDAGVPVASIIFVVLLIGLFAARTTTTEEAAEEGEEGEEESSSELASSMITAFDEKTNLINSLWTEISSKDPNEVDKEFFDELRSRLDSFRSRALQRLNEVRQKSASQKFAEVVNQIQATEREVDRAAKDKLNLYQQFYLRQMRQEVFDRLLPQYTKRLERALNQLSDELHNVQRESKAL